MSSYGRVALEVVCMGGRIGGFRALARPASARAARRVLSKSEDARAGKCAFEVARSSGARHLVVGVRPTHGEQLHSLKEGLEDEHCHDK